ncbi:MAG: rubrerythrin family protein [Anaerolineaceae bacterium]
MTKTHENLMAAYAGESQANHRYLAFAKKADQEGYPQIARLFRAAAAAEAVHAGNHLRADDGVKSTMENLSVALGGENYEVNSMYPPMLATAVEEDDKKAATSFHWALEVEKIHSALYSATLENMESKDTYEYTVCPTCGYTHKGPAPDKCPVCGSAGSKFVTII